MAARAIMIAMGKIIVKEESVNDLADDNLKNMAEKKSKSTVKPGSELVLAPSRAVAVAASPKTGTKKAGAKLNAKGGKSGNKTTKTTDGVTKKSNIKVVDLGGDASDEENSAAKASKTAKTGVKSGAKSVSGMVIDSTVKPNSKIKADKIDAEADGYALDEAKLADEKKKDDVDDEFVGEPRFTKGKSALIGVAVALIVALVGFVGIWFFTREPVESCIVRFEPNGGSYVNSTEMICGNKVAKPEDPTKDGFDFQGWVYDGAPFDFANDIVDRDMILVAKWAAQDNIEIVRVKFDTAGGSAIEGFDIAKGGIMTPPLTPTKPGYIFDGWYLGDERFDFLNEINEDITLTAHWKEAPQEITNNGSGSNNNSGSQGSTSNGTNSNTPQIRCDYLRREGVSFEDLKVGASRTLMPQMAYMNTAECKVAYRSSNENILKIDGNKVVGVKAGKATLSICVQELSGGKDLDCVAMEAKVIEEPKVPDPVAVTGVTVDKGGKLSLEVGADGMVNWTVYPVNASDKAVTLVSSDSSVATVDGTGKVTAKKVGTAVITVTTRDGGKTATVEVTVTGGTVTPPEETCEDGKVPDGNGGCKEPEPSEEENCVNSGGTWEGGACVKKPEEDKTE